MKTAPSVSIRTVKKLQDRRDTGQARGFVDAVEDGTRDVWGRGGAELHPNLEQDTDHPPTVVHEGLIGTGIKG